MAEEEEEEEGTCDKVSIDMMAEEEEEEEEYTLVRHAGFGFEKDAGHWVMKPFYKDHTSYGAVLAMAIPPMLALLTWLRL